MRHALRWLHLIAVAGFMGAVAASLLIAARADSMSPTAFAAARQLIESVGNYLALPSLTVLVVSGMLLVAVRPIWMEARWVWTKALIGALIGALFLVWLQPALHQAAVLSGSTLALAPSFEALQASVQIGWTYSALVLVLSLVASVIAVWRPRLGQGHDGPTAGDS